jgi:hypothetical protein
MPVQPLMPAEPTSTPIWLANAGRRSPGDALVAVVRGRDLNLNTQRKTSTTSHTCLRYYVRDATRRSRQLDVDTNDASASEPPAGDDFLDEAYRSVLSDFTA